VDSGHLKAGENADGRLNWEQALQWAEELEYAGHSDWRLPSVKELQSIVDYTRSPETTNSAAIDPLFESTPIRDAAGEKNWGFYWSGTTHARGRGGQSAAYVAFGRSQGWMRNYRGQYSLLDVHGAGSQRSDPKVGDPSQFPRGRGPQGDVISIFNFVRPVRGGEVRLREDGPPLESGTADRRSQQPGGEGRPGPGRPGAGGPAGAGPPPFVERLDRNGDGKVSREEFDGPPDAFDRHDADKDGFLIESEAPLGPPPPRPLLQRGRRSQRPLRLGAASRPQ